MADNDQSKIRYDDFIGSIQPDPAKPESTIMLSGFVGHGPEGHARIYPDPTLGTWYDIPEADILHSMPIADSKLGGSYVWVRANSEIKPGNAAPAAPEAEAAQPQQAAAAVQPTPTVQTHCFICPPHTQAVHCWTQPVLCDTMQTPTPATRCFICPPHTQNCTPATICTLHGHCPPQPSVAPTLCTIPQTLPCSLLCQADPRAGGVAAPQQAATGMTVCFTDCQPPGNAMMKPAAGMNPTPRTQCFVCDPPMAAAAVQPPAAHTPATICTLAPPCLPMTPPIVCTQAVMCPTNPVPCDTMQMPTPATICTHAPPCPPMTPPIVCTQAVMCPTNPVPCDTMQMPTPATICTHAPPCPPMTPPIVCTQAVMCPTNPVPCDTMQMPTPATRCFICPPPNQTPATVCTHALHCPTQPVVCNLQPTQPVVCGVLPPSVGCTQGCQQGGAHPQLEARAAPAHPNTAATLCTQQPACPPHTVHNSICICPTPSAVNQCGGPAHPTLATVCTLPPGCPPHTVHNSMCICPTPSAVHQCGGQTPFTPTIPQFTVVGACPTFGVCPSIACGFTPVQNGVFTPFGR
jgi:hypothetical protein